MTFPIIPARTASSASYQVSRSLRFRNASSTYLSRTFSSVGNRKTWTWSGWVKRGYLSGTPVAPTMYQDLFGAYSTGSDTTYMTFGFKSNDAFFVGGWTTAEFRLSTPVYRDPSAWMHVLVVMNTPDATASNRLRVYINGTEITAWATNVALTQNGDYGINQACLHRIGHDGVSGGYYFDGYMADVNFIDGQALTPSSFGSLDTNGVWQPKAYTGTYGTNGFYLKFSDNTSTTTLCTDYSGNSNSFTPTSISLSGTTYDSMIDSPTNYADGGTGRGNYAVLNPLQSGAYVSQTNGNLTNTGNTATNSALVLATIGNLTSGKWYWEYTQGTVQSETCGIVTTYTPGTSLLNGEGIGSYGIGARATGAVYGGTVGTITSWTNGDIIGLAVDCDNGAIYWSKNGNWLNSGVPTSGSSKTGAVGVWTPSSSINVTPAFGAYNGGFVSVTFGQRPFAYTPPSGFSALNTQNMNTPTIANGAQYMAATIWSGNSGTQNIANTVNSVSFQPDFIWSKCRNVARSHRLIDAVRGVTKQLYSDYIVGGEATPTSIIAFLPNGFTTYNEPSDAYNVTGENYVSWQWNAGGAPTTDNVAGAGNVPTAGSVKINGANSSATLAGSIAATRLSANTSAGFSVVTWTGQPTSTGTNTIAHGLGVAPSFIIVKNRNYSDAFYCYNSNLGNAAHIVLNTNAAQVTTSGVWGTTSPNSTVFTIRNGSLNVATTDNLLAYCFAPISQYSSFGTFVGNNSADGPFVFTNFRPRYLLVKRADGLSQWSIFDSTRGPYNVNTPILFSNAADAEVTAYPEMDFLSNGFKIRANDANSYLNVSGGTYIYAAFAENPFKYSRAR